MLGGDDAKSYNSMVEITNVVLNFIFEINVLYIDHAELYRLQHILQGSIYYTCKFVICSANCFILHCLLTIDIALIALHSLTFPNPPTFFNLFYKQLFISILEAITSFRSYFIW